MSDHQKDDTDTPFWARPERLAYRLNAATRAYDRLSEAFGRLEEAYSRLEEDYDRLEEDYDRLEKKAALQFDGYESAL